MTPKTRFVDFSAKAQFSAICPMLDDEEDMIHLYSNILDKGQQYSSASQEDCHQSWRPEFESPQGRRE